MQYGFSFRADSIVPLAVETVLYKAHLFRVAAVQHFLHCLVVFWAVVERMDLLELIPVVLKNTLKGFLVNTFRGSPLRTTITGWAQKSRKKLVSSQKLGVRLGKLWEMQTERCVFRFLGFRRDGRKSPGNPQANPAF